MFGFVLHVNSIFDVHKISYTTSERRIQNISTYLVKPLSKNVTGTPPLKLYPNPDFFSLLNKGVLDVMVFTLFTNGNLDVRVTPNFIHNLCLPMCFHLDPQKTTPIVDWTEIKIFCKINVLEFCTKRTSSSFYDQVHNSGHSPGNTKGT